MAPPSVPAGCSSDLGDAGQIPDVEDTDAGGLPGAGQGRRVVLPVDRAVVRVAAEQRTAHGRAELGVQVLGQIDLELELRGVPRFVDPGDVEDLDASGAALVGGDDVGGCRDR